MKLSLIIFCQLLSFALFASENDAPKFVSGYLGFSELNAFGSNYQSRNFTTTQVGGNFQWGLSPRLAIRFLGDLSTGGETFSLGSGLFYYFIPLQAEKNYYGPGNIVTHTPLFSYDVGISLGMTRLQTPLARTDSTQSDVVLAGLVGPTLHFGGLYSLTSTTYLTAEIYDRYALGPGLGATQMGVNVGVSYMLP